MRNWPHDSNILSVIFLGMDGWILTVSPGLIWPRPTATEARLVARLEASRQEIAETRDIVVVVVVLLCCVPELGLDCGCGERTSADIMGEWRPALYRPVYTSWTTRDFWHSLEGCSKLGINVSSSQTLFIIPRIVRTPPPTITRPLSPRWHHCVVWSEAISGYICESTLRHLLEVPKSSEVFMRTSPRYWKLINIHVDL